MSDQAECAPMEASSKVLRSYKLGFKLKVVEEAK